MIVLGAVVCSAGCGLLLPTLLVCALGPLSLAERGRANGVWFSCVTTAQFACPLAVLAIGAAAGGYPGPSSCSAYRRSSWRSPPAGYGPPEGLSST